MGILRNSGKINYLGVYSNFLKDYGFKERRPSCAAFLKTRPNTLAGAIADERVTGPLTNWRFVCSSHDELLSEEVLGSMPYQLLREGVPVWGWLLETVKDETIRVSYEGRPYQLVFAFDFEHEHYCTSWIVDFSGFVHDDSPSDIALMQLAVSDPVLLLFCKYRMQAIPFLGLGVEAVV